ncbi:facilitated trehalose transporter Tret1-like isoform X2 [Athalia rosae]|uniref:facilitated trehalose transporter Tret1-like isoform X2 n=1 Tax=Athalia rosae TaxID=37344 RepID=UPI002034A0C0|nr:facilitated trehalose transporter Tret1-like isoform X2 [Athalia rosae]
MECKTARVFRLCSVPKQILWLQWTAGFAGMLMLFVMGLKVGWTSPFMARLVAEDSVLPLTAGEVSWVASLLNFGRFCGSLLGGFFVEYLGSRRTLIGLGFPLILAWICIISANSATWLYVARIAAGSSLGMAFNSFPLLLGEISSPSIRGTLVAFVITGMPLGTMIGVLMGPYLSMQVFSYIGLVPTVIFIVLFWWLPESPHYLLKHGRIEEAGKSIERYNPYADREEELKSLKDFLSSNGNLTFRERLREVNLPKNRRAILLMLALYFFMQFSGVNSVMFYTETIVIRAKVNVIDPSSVVTLFGTFSVVSSLLSIFVADKLPRKVILIIASLGVGVSLLSLGIHFELLDRGCDPASLQWLPIASLMGFVFFLCNGLVSIPSTILSEIFTQNVKSVAVCVGNVSVGIFAFIATGTYLPLVDLIGEAYVYWGNVVILIACAIFTKLVVPETRGKTLQEIQEAFDKK